MNLIIQYYKTYNNIIEIIKNNNKQKRKQNNVTKNFQIKYHTELFSLEHKNKL